MFTGINTILKSLPLEDGDEIFVYTYTYGAVRKATESAAFKSGLNFYGLRFSPATLKNTKNPVKRGHLRVCFLLGVDRPFWVLHN